MKKLSIILGLLLISLIVLGSCGSKKDSISVGGSTSVSPLMEILGDEYLKSENVQVSVSANGSSAGIEAAAKGTVNLGMSSRNLKDEELEQGVTSIEIAKDAITIVVHKDNDVKNLTTEQIKGIYDGTITNWKELDGEDKKIEVVTRENGSGTRGAFEENLELLDDEKASTIVASATTKNSNGSVLATVAGNKYAVGYISLGSVTKEVHSVNVNDVKATEENVINGLYPIARPFVIVEGKDTNDAAKKFVEFILSPEGQKIIEDEGYIRVK